MRISNIIISFLLLMASPLHAISKETYDFGTISQDTTLFWDGELPMYTPAIDYYPFGSLIAESQNAELQPYLYNGKELDRMNGLDWYDYGARMLESDGIRWGQVDPRAEDNVYCHNNPILRIDPTGEFDFEGTIAHNTFYPVIAVFPSKCDKIITNDKIAAKNAGVPIIVVDNKWDFANAMQELSARNNTTNCYTINSHGTGGNFNKSANFDIGNEKVDINSDFSILREGLKNHTVFIGACNVGNISGGGDELVEKIAESTSSTVIASDHPLKSGYKYDGSDYLNYTIIEIPSQPIIKNDYILSHKGNLSIPIKDVKIDKKFGITWGNNFQWGYLIQLFSTLNHEELFISNFYGTCYIMQQHKYQNFL